MNATTANEDMIRYDVLVQEALRGVVKKVLQEIVKTGLPGQHHLYISFDTQYPGVRLSTRMRQRYPEEMTIVLQHQFWDLAVTDHALEVGLSFGGVPERLLVPFVAIKGFFDPSVQFGLQFEVEREPAPVSAPGPDATRTPTLATVPTKADPLPKPEPIAPAAEPPAAVEKSDAAETKPEPSSATVISMDHFRKKS